jgi:hypothetical protein
MSMRLSDGMDETRMALPTLRFEQGVKMVLPHSVKQSKIQHLCCGGGPYVNDANGHFYACNVQRGGCGAQLRGDDNSLEELKNKHFKECFGDDNTPKLEVVSEPKPKPKPDFKNAWTQGEYITACRDIIDGCGKIMELEHFISQRGFTRISYRIVDKDD